MKKIAYLLTGVALTVTAAVAQDLTPFQRQALGGFKKMLVETIQKQHAICASTSEEVCDVDRVDVLDEVLANWENTPDYGRYAVDMMEWQGELRVAIAKMADDYVRRHGHPDVGMMQEIRRKTTGPAFYPPKEYTCRHLFGVLHLYGAQGDHCK